MARERALTAPAAPPRGVGVGSGGGSDGSDASSDGARAGWAAPPTHETSGWVDLGPVGKAEPEATKMKGGPGSGARQEPST